jgi:maltooligosyltrehalose trehalohydrolase
MLEFYRQLIRLRRSRPEFSDPRLDKVEVTCGDQYLTMNRQGCAVVCNFAPDKRRIGLAGTPRDVLLATDPGTVMIRTAVELPPQSAVVVSYV